MTPNLEFCSNAENRDGGAWLREQCNTHVEDSITCGKLSLRNERGTVLLVAVFERGIVSESKKFPRSVTRRVP